MRTIVPPLMGLVALLATSCAGAQTPPLPAGNLALQLEHRIDDDRLVTILNNAEMVNLNELAGGAGQSLVVRLYGISVQGDCVPETHLTCGYEYYLAVSEYDEQPRQSVFALGTVGEIVVSRWLEAPGEDAAALRLDVANYPAMAAQRNPALERKLQAYRLTIRVDKLAVGASMPPGHGTTAESGE